ERTGRDPGRADGARRRRPGPLVPQRPPLGGGTQARSRTAAGARSRRGRARPRGRRAQLAERPRAGLRRGARPRRRQGPGRRDPRRRDPVDRQHPRGRRDLVNIPAGKLPLPELSAMKDRGEKIVMVTAYDAPGARFAEDAGIDVILVGDTAAMVVLGYEGTTVPVTVDEMLLLTRTVSRQARRPIVAGDMPFGSYQVSDEDAVRNAIRFVKEGGADVVKLEGAGPMVSRVRRIVEAGIPVMVHIGLTPQ